MNLVEATVENGEVSFGPQRLRIDRARPGLTRYRGKRIALGMRPEDLEDAQLVGGSAEDASFEAEIDIREDMGSEVFLHFALDARAVITEDVRDAAEDEAVEAAEAQAEVRGHQCVARVARESGIREGDRARLAVRTDRLHFFDLETGSAIYD